LPRATGLFNSAIQQSGSGVNTWAMSYNPREMAFKLGDKLEIETSDSAELVARLAEFSPKELVTASMELIKTEVRGRVLDFSSITFMFSRFCAN